MNIGRMRHKITIMQPGGRAQDGTDLASVPFVTRFAQISSLQGNELLKAQQIVENVTHKIVMRYYPGVNSSMTVSYNGRTFVIQAVLNPDERTRELDLLCVERNQQTS